MLELIFYLAAIVIILTVLFYASMFFIAGIAYGYWGLSITMAPVVWLILLVGMLTGLVCTVKNAIKEVKILHGKGGES